MADRSISCSPALQPPKRPPTAASHFADPPSSPPPTSPLPLLPISISPISSTGSLTPQPRLPRLQVSLPDLRPNQNYAAQPSRHLVTLHAPESPVMPVGHLLRSPVKIVSQPSIVMGSAQDNAANTGSRIHDDLGKGSSQIQDNLQMERSQDARRSLAFDRVPETRPCCGTTPNIPPKSPKRRTRNLPQKAVARSPLHIPPHVGSGSKGIRTTNPTPLSQTATPLLMEGLITSLPQWPCTSIYPHLAYIKATGYNKNGTLRASEPSPIAISCPGSLREGQKSGSSQDQDRISFRAVTNLEGPIARKEASSATLNSDYGEARHMPKLNWYYRHRKLVWITVTVCGILLVTGGILAGILWKLSQS